MGTDAQIEFYDGDELLFVLPSSLEALDAYQFDINPVQHQLISNCSYLSIRVVFVE